MIVQAIAGGVGRSVYSGAGAKGVGALVATLLTLGASDAGAQCTIAGAPTEHDRELAVAACERVVERFTLLFGAPPPAGTLEISDEVNVSSVQSLTRDWHLAWPSSTGLREYLSESPPVDQTVEEAVAIQWTTVLPHELGHVLLSAEMDRRRPDGPPRELPDWLHEGTAVWMEPAGYRGDELEIIRALRPFIPSLDDLTSLSISSPSERGEAGTTITRTFYPCASVEACGGRPHWSETFSVVTRQYPDGRVETDTIFHAEPPPPPDPTAANFYAYSATLVRYLFDRGGSTLMDGLLERYATSAEGPVPLTGLPGLARGNASLQRDWEVWFRRWIFRD